MIPRTDSADEAHDRVDPEADAAHDALAAIVGVRLTGIRIHRAAHLYVFVASSRYPWWSDLRTRLVLRELLARGIDPFGDP